MPPNGKAPSYGIYKRKNDSNRHGDRYRIVFSDTDNFIQSMLATQSNHLVTSGDLEKGCFVRLNAYQANQVKDKKYDIRLNPHNISDVLQNLDCAQFRCT